MANLVGGEALAGDHRTFPKQDAFIFMDRRLGLKKVRFDVILGSLTRIISNKDIGFFFSEIELC
jgi:hypothetical protein